MLERGELKPAIDRTYELSEAQDALRTFGEGHVRGKLVSRCNNSRQNHHALTGIRSSSGARASSTRVLAAIVPRRGAGVLRNRRRPRRRRRDADGDDLVERLGRAAAAWCGRGASRRPRHARQRAASSRTRSRPGSPRPGSAVLAGVLPTPAVALLGLDLAAVISASHDPPEYNGVILRPRRRELTDAAEEEIEALLDSRLPAAARSTASRSRPRTLPRAVLERFGTDLGGLRIAVDCANGAPTPGRPQAFEQLGAEVTAIGDEPDGTNINVGCGATDLSLPARAPCAPAASTSASPSTATATGCSRSTSVESLSTATRSSPSSRSTSASTAWPSRP